MTSEVFDTNGFGDRVDLRRIRSDALELDEPADIVVCDQIGGFAHEVGLTKVVADLIARGQVKSGARILPAAFDLLLGAVEVPDESDPIRPWRVNNSDLSFEPFARAAANTPFRLTAEESWLLGPAVEGGRLDPTDEQPFVVAAELTITRSGRLTGLLGMMRAHLDERDGVTISNVLGADDRFRRWHLYHPFDQPLDVEEGQTIKAEISVHQEGELSNWKVARGGDQRSGAQFMGAFLDRRSLFDPKPGTAALSESGACLKLVLDAIEADESFDDTVHQLVKVHPRKFPTAGKARRYARENWAFFTD